MRTTLAMLAGLASSIAIADPAVQLDQRIQQAERDLAELQDLAGGGLRANSCGAAPLPTTPVGPSTTMEWQYAALYGDRVRVTAWRIPCNATESMPVLTLEPIVNANQAFICAPRITLLQAGGLQTNAFWLRNDPPTSSSFCGSVLQTVTVALTPSSTTPTSFDFDQGMTISYTGGGSAAVVQPLALSAFDPSQYSLTPPPGNNAVEVHVRGSGAHYRNCTVTQGSQGGGTLYTASCADESPLKRGGFGRFDY